MKKSLLIALASAATALAGLVTAPAALAAGATYFASPTGSGTVCTEEAAPCALTEAVAKAGNEDAVVLLPGTYALGSDLRLGKAVELGGRPGAVPTIEGRVIAEAASRARFHDLRIEGKFEPKVGVSERIFVDHTGSGPACELSARVGFTSLLRDSVCWSHEGSTTNRAISISLFAGDPVVLRNDTFVSAAPEGVGVEVLAQPQNASNSVEIVNSIARGGAKGLDVFASAEGAETTATVRLSHSSYARLEARGPSTITNPETEGNQLKAPLFVDAANGDFAETSSSPTLEAGLNEPANNGTLAVGGEARTLGLCAGGAGVTDIGAYEFVPSVPCVAPPAGPNPPNPGVKPPIGVAPSNRFGLGKLKLDRTRGTASLEISLPDAGRVTASGKGLKKVTRTAKGETRVTVPIKAVGKALKTLQAKGKVRIAVKLKFSPNGGLPATKTKPMTLKLGGGAR